MENMENTPLMNTTIKSTFLGFRRTQRKLHPKYALLKINNVGNRQQAELYIDNAVYFSWNNRKGELVENRGVIKSVHGNKGVVVATFQRNLNPAFVGHIVNVKAYKMDASA